MRAFVAIDMPEPVRDALEAVQAGLTVGRLTDPDTLHLTLAFLGEQPESVLAELHGQLSGLAAPRFELRLQGLGSFGSRAPSVIWAGVAPLPALAELRDKVRGAVRRAGIELPRERFRPHVTLARFRRGMRPEAVLAVQRFVAENAGFAAPAFTVERVSLFQSTLRPDGPLHEVLAEYPLDG